ncbi:acyl-CoA N-acyltransferase [Xylaria palmicola]|nr:acyl-CoA N-acyltransferase [Xylaria palmicola]
MALVGLVASSSCYPRGITPVQFAAMNIYESKRLVYVPIGETRHEDFIYTLMQEPGALNFDTSLPVGFPRSEVGSVVKIMASRKLMSMYICEPNTPMNPFPIGVISLSKPEERQAQHGSSSLSVMIVSEYQRQGYGKEAIAWALDWAFDFARLHRVEVACYGWNPGARRLYSHIGFREEGVKREVVWFMGGWHHMYELAMLEHEWRGEWRDAANAETWAPDDGQGYSSEQIAQKMGSS